jgi:hypothetical protein
VRGREVEELRGAQEERRGRNDQRVGRLQRQDIAGLALRDRQPVDRVRRKRSKAEQQ